MNIGEAEVEAGHPDGEGADLVVVICLQPLRKVILP